jgi:hypothetical protein
MTTESPKELTENMPEGDAPVKKEEEVVNQVDAVDNKGEDKTDTIVTQQEQTPKDDCSDLTDNNNDGEEQIPRSFPQKVSACCNNKLDVCMSRPLCGMSLPWSHATVSTTVSMLSCDIYVGRRV